MKKRVLVILAVVFVLFFALSTTVSAYESKGSNCDTCHPGKGYKPAAKTTTTTTTTATTTKTKATKTANYAVGAEATVTKTVAARNQANNKAGVVATLNKNDKVTIMAMLGNFYNVKTAGGAFAFVPKSSVKITKYNAVTSVDGYKGVISAKSILLRASINGKKVATLKKGYVVTVKELSKNWYKVDYNGTVGWISASYVIVNQNPGPPAPPPPTMLEITSLISSEWLTAGHATTSGTLAYTGVRGASCTPCHTGNQLERIGTANPFTSAGFATFVSGEYTGDSAYGYKVNYNIADMPSPIGCASCHAATGGDIMKSGIVPPAASQFTSLGVKVAWNVGNSNALCYTCHNGRRDIGKIYSDWAAGTFSNSGTYPHHGWDALVVGKGMEYTGVTYPQSTAHTALGCIGCHMGKTSKGYTAHTFKPDTTVCTKCHAGANMAALEDAMKKTLEAKLAQLKTLVLAKVPGAVGIGTDHSFSPVYKFKADGVTKERISEKNVGNADVLIAAYNWAIVAQELEHGAKGVHNPKYANALLDESINRLK